MSTPGIVTGLTSANAIALGNNYSCALKTNGTVRCWGQDNQQQLGNGSADVANQHTPMLVSGVANVIAIDATF